MRMSMTEANSALQGASPRSSFPGSGVAGSRAQTNDILHQTVLTLAQTVVQEPSSEKNGGKTKSRNGLEIAQDSPEAKAIF